MTSQKRKKDLGHSPKDESHITVPSSTNVLSHRKGSALPFRVAGLLVLAYLATLCGVFYVSFNRIREIGGEDIKIPRSLEDLQHLNEAMVHMKHTHMTLLLVFFCSLYIIKQSLCIPGSLWLNLWAGGLFGITFGYPLVCLLTAAGASSCYLISLLIGRRLVERYFPAKLQQLHTFIHSRSTPSSQGSSSLWMTLVFLRVVPFTPNWFLNLTAPILDVPFHYFWSSCLVGLAAYNFIGVQAGTVIGDIRSPEDILTTQNLLKLCGIAGVCLAFVLIKNRLTSRQSTSQGTEGAPS